MAQPVLCSGSTDFDHRQHVVSQPTVLIASMNPSRRRQLARAIAQDGYRVCECMLDDSVLRRMGPRDTGLEVAIFDLAETPNRGLALLEALRALDWGLRVILLARREDASLRHEAARLGANATFIQPFELEDLRTVVLNVAPRS